MSTSLSDDDGGLHASPTRYRNQTIDPSVPIIFASRLLSKPPNRPGRRSRTTPIDPNAHQFYGDAVIQKTNTTTRLFFQNSHGLTHTNTLEDYRYYMACLQAYDVDIIGLSETNTCWSHPHLKSDFKTAVRRFHKQSKVSFGSPTQEIDPCPNTESYQAGGNLTMVNGPMSSRVYGADIQDPSGLGRWSGFTLLGKDNNKLTIITAYRVCHGSPSSASLGSSFLREYEYLRTQQNSKPNPRRQFLTDLQALVLQLQNAGHATIVMLDANSTLTSDTHFSDFIALCGLNDLHSDDPAPSTYIGSADRRIDFILGCDRVLSSLSRSGTLSYTEGPQSDHRGMYVDLDLSFLQRPSWDMITPTNARGLYTGNPELVEKYHSTMLAYYANHNMISRIDDLYKSHMTMSRDELRRELIKWDNNQGRAMEHSEGSLKISKKKCAWSHQLRDSAIVRRYWSLRLRELIRNENYHCTFIRWQEKIRVHQPHFTFEHLDDHLSLDQVREHFNRANRAFRKCQRQATSLRNQTYYDLLATYEDDTDPNTKVESHRKAKIVRNTLAGECTRSKFSNIRRVVKPTTTSSLSKIMIPASESFNPESDSMYQYLQEDTQHESMLWETIVEREEIERHLLNYNQESFRAAASSPCGHGIIHDALTFTSLSSDSERLLRGEIPPEWNIDDIQLRELLASFTIPQHVRDQPPIQTTVTSDDVKNCFKAWKEATSTSPSGRHLGHYKAIIAHPVLLHCFVQFMNIVIARGIAIPRWCNATNVMIEKDSGKPRINRLRIVHLFEADLNFYLKLQWGHRLVRQAIKLNILHDSQHGSIPGRAAMDPIMLTQLTSDLCRILKHDLLRFDNDASACYDRIIVALGMLAARRCGMPKNAIRLHAEALQFMRYTVKTVYGISEENYSGTIFEPLFGTGQGSGASPAVWLSLVVLLLHTLDRIIPDRMNFQSPSRRTHSRLSDAFVDDTSMGFTSSESSVAYEDLIQRLEHLAQSWEHLLHLSGGQLNLKKCSWFVMRWEWHSGRPTLRPIKSIDRPLRLHSGSITQHKTTIRQTSLDSSTRMLGVMLNPLGTFSDHLSFLKKRADEYARRLLSPRITSSDAAIFHQSIYIPSMRYSLAALAVDEESLSGIQTLVIKSMLQKMGYSSKIPTAIRHGPPELGGLGIYDLRTEAGLEALKFFRNSIYENSETANLLRINLESSQRESGILQPLLQHPNIYLSYLTPSWVMSLRQYMSLHNLTLTITDIYQDTLRSPSDEMIMQPGHLLRYTEAQQRDLNLVRLYLQVSKLSDMADPDQPNKIALRFLDAARHCDTALDPSWPRQEKPSATQRRLWKRFIVSSYLRYIPYWKSSPLPSSLPATTLSLEPPNPRLLSTVIKELPRTQRRLLDGLEQMSTDDKIFKAFRSKIKLHVASDGGLHNNSATHGWVISTGTEVLYQGSGPVDGPLESHTSTRSELGGCASVLLLLTSLSKIWGTKHRCTFTWYTDSRSAISRVLKFSRRRSSRRRMPPDVDLLTIISDCIKELRRSFKAKWIKAHQDRVVSYDQLPLAARLNIDADFLATRYRSHGKLRTSPQVDHVPGQQLSIHLNGQPLLNNFDDQIRFHVNSYHHRRYVQEHNGWDDPTWHDVDLHSFGSHLKRLSPGHKSQHIKFIHDLLPLGLRRHREAAIKTDTLMICPCCRDKTETPLHFLQCAANELTSSLDQLRKDLWTADTHPVRYVLFEGIQHWSHGNATPFCPAISQYPSHLQPLIAEAVRCQNVIGWHQALKGYLSKQWHILAMYSMDSTKLDQGAASQRIRCVLRSFHAHTRRLWISRNSVLHSSEIADMADIRSQEIAEIKFYHSHPHLLLSTDQHHCQRSLSRLLSASSSTRRRWLRIVKRSSADLTKDGTRQTRLTSFFPTKS